MIKTVCLTNNEQPQPNLIYTSQTFEELKFGECFKASEGNRKLIHSKGNNYFISQNQNIKVNEKHSVFLRFSTLSFKNNLLDFNLFISYSNILISHVRPSNLTPTSSNTFSTSFLDFFSSSKSFSISYLSYKQQSFFFSASLCNLF